MSERWSSGLLHFSRGNYYAARDLWESEAAEVLSLKSACRVANGLAAVYRQILGTEAARSQMEHAYALSQRTEIDKQTEMKILSNMGILLCFLGHVTDGREFCRKAFSMIESDFPYESFTAFNAYTYALTCVEGFEQVWELRHEFERLSDEVGNAEIVRLFSPSFYSNVSQSAEMMGKFEDALTYAEKACGNSNNSPYIVYVGAHHLRHGRYDQALQYLDDIYHVCFGADAYKEQRKLARAIEFLGLLADMSGETALARRCIEKAELYFGQLGQWNEWLTMREYEFQRVVQIPSGFLRTDDLSAFLDNLTLLDGIKLMFPDVFRMSQLATDLAVRMFRSLPVVKRQSMERDVQLAGRLSYIGLNALAVNEADAKRALLSSEKSNEMTQVGLKLLEAYPHTATLRELIASGRTPGHGGFFGTDDVSLASQCLAISFHYVEGVELRQLPHEEAVRSVVNHPLYAHCGQPLAVFISHMTLEKEGTPA